MAPGGDVNTTLPMVLSILCLACCCLPLGIVGLINAMNANKAKQVGDLATAQAKAKAAQLWSIIGIVAGVVVYTVAIVVQIAMNN